MAKCPRCRTVIPHGEKECPFCRKHFPELLDEEARANERKGRVPVSVAREGPVDSGMIAAGFWRRLAAAIPDLLVCSGIAIPAEVLFRLAVYPPASAEVFFGIFAVTYVVFSSVMESSRYQATFGKVLFGIIVTDTFGRRLSFSRALLREAGKYISLLVFGLGFLMIGFTGKKQGLHDMIALTQVILRDSVTAGKLFSSVDHAVLRKRLRWGSLIVLAGILLSAVPFLYLSVIQHEPVTPAGITARGLAGAGDTLATSTHPEYALPVYDTAIALQPNNTAILMKKISVLGNTGSVEEARVYLDRMVVMYPNETSPVIYQGDLFLAEKNYPDAIACYETAISHDPKNAKIWVKKGDAYLSQATEEMAKIRDMYRNLTAKKPGSVPGTVSADAFRSTGPYQEAVKAYNTAIELDPMTSIAITGRILSSTQHLLDTYEGILDDIHAT